jgi:hypothetical protein
MRRSAAVPITHTPPSRLMPPDPFCPESPIGLDDLPSRIVVTETNDFLRPPALRSRRKPARFDYGMPPPSAPPTSGNQKRSRSVHNWDNGRQASGVWPWRPFSRASANPAGR